MRKALLKPFGLFIILLGIAGLLLPIIPGWALIFLGLSIVAPGLAVKVQKHVLRKLFKANIVFLEEWKALPVAAGFTTRHFPLLLRSTEDLSEPYPRQKFHSLIYQLLKERYPRYSMAGHFVYLNQVHGDQVACFETAGEFWRRRYFRLAATDAVITNIHDLVLLVMTADCLPIFFYAGKSYHPRISKGFSWIGLAHAGWRGTYQEIAKKTARLLCEKSGCHPKDLRVTFGPCIGFESYEVGEEFSRFFPEGHPSHRSLRRHNGRWHFDLAGENRRQLIEFGVPALHIEDQGICTFKENIDFHSYRRQKTDAGRIISFISLR